MANMYTQFSIGFNVTEEQAAWLKAERARMQAEYEENDELEPPNFIMEAERPFGNEEILCWIADEEGSSPLDPAINLLAEFTRVFPGKPISLEFAFTCDRPRIGEFGGGVAVIHKGHVYVTSTGEITSKQLRLIEEDEAAWFEANPIWEVEG